MSGLIRTIFVPLVMAGVLMDAQAEQVTLDISEAETQKGRNLCWAASSVTVLRIRPPRVLLAPGVPLISQESFAAYQMLHKQLDNPFAVNPSLEHLKSSQVAAVLSSASAGHRARELLSRCQGTGLETCDEAGVPILLDQHFKTESNSALTWKRIVHEISAGRPILFGWESKDQRDGRGYGLHYSVMVGFRDTDGQRMVKIWDPWVPITGATPQREKWIQYCVYRNARNFMGEPNLLYPNHYNFGGPPDTESAPTPVGPDGECPPDPDPLRQFVRSPLPTPTINVIQSRFGDETRIRETLSSQLLPRPGGPLRLGPVLPVLALSSGEIQQARGSAATLIRNEFSAVILPVLRRHEVVDALLAVQDASGNWSLDGYANTSISALLLDQREGRTLDADLHQGQVYAVTIPSRGMFFAAEGIGKAAVLTPILDDPSIKARAGEPQSAKDVLRQLWETRDASP